MSRKLSPALVCAATASALVLSSTAAAPAGAQTSSLSSNGGSSLISSAGGSEPKKPPSKTASRPVSMPNGTTIQVMDDVLGRYSAHVGFRAGDLGMMAPVGTGEEFAMLFGDSFTISFGQGLWMSPVGVLAKMNEDGFIEIIRPLNDGDRVEPLVTYFRRDMETLLPSDIINIGGTLYMQAMWNESLHNVTKTEIFKSTNNGKKWTSVATTSHDYYDGIGDLITWEKGPDGYIYVMSSTFTRSEPVYLSRFRAKDIADRGKWEFYRRSTGEWNKGIAEPILEKNVKAGEMNLRYIDGHWVLVMFNEETLSVEVRISETLERNWDEITPAKIAEHGRWSLPQTPVNWSQPYGGYIVPGSTLDNMDIVVSQWNTETNRRYMSTQFNVKGLDTFFGVERKAVPDDSVIWVDELPATDLPQMDAEDNLVAEQAPRSSSSSDLSSGSSEGARTAGIVIGVLAGAGVLAFLAAPLLKQVLPEPIANLIP